jgi:ankyrin repeat protein
VTKFFLCLLVFFITGNVLGQGAAPKKTTLAPQSQSGQNFKGNDHWKKIESSFKMLPPNVGKAFTLVAEGKSVELLELLKKDPSLVKYDYSKIYNQETPFWLSLYTGNFNVIKVWVDAGVNVTQKNKSDFSSVHIAILSKFFDPRTLDLLVAKSANVNDQNNPFALAPLHLAIKMRNEVGVRALIKNGARVDLKNKNGETPEAMAKKLNVAHWLKPMPAPTPVKK